MKKQQTMPRDIVQHNQLINHIGNIKIGYCNGCDKIDTCFTCIIYISPIDHCRIGCAFSPVAHNSVIAENKRREQKQRQGQQKQKKKK